jgi:lipopolysaccharide transport system ATP-binding protein
LDLPGFKKPEKDLPMSSDDFAIKVENLSKCYQIYDKPNDRLKQFVLPRLQRLLRRKPKQFFRAFWALKDVSFEIKKGETVGIIGRNGSGKSTLLQLICGTLTPTNGNIQTNGRIAALLELGSGFNPEFTGRENIYMSASILGLSKEETDDRFDEIAAFADIGEFIEQPVKTYSSGMYVRLAFAVNIISEPEIMIVDEALAVGDMAFQAKCMTALTRIQDRGTTVLFVSHDINALKSLCSRGIYLDHGKVQQIASAGEVAENYTRKMREEMNAEAASGAFDSESLKAIAPSQDYQSGKLEFKTSTAFEKQVAQFRYGDGGAKITYAELLDDKFNSISEVRFNQTAYVRIYFEAEIDDKICCNYYVLDDKRNLILGASLDLVDNSHPLLNVKIGGKYVVTYKSRLPLQEGSYSIQLQLTMPVVYGHTARFLDVVDDAVVFRMSRREGTRIWTKTFVENEVEILSC